MRHRLHKYCLLPNSMILHCCISEVYHFMFKTSKYTYGRRNRNGQYYTYLITKCIRLLHHVLCIRCSDYCIRYLLIRQQCPDTHVIHVRCSISIILANKHTNCTKYKYFLRSQQQILHILTLYMITTAVHIV